MPIDPNRRFAKLLDVALLQRVLPAWLLGMRWFGAKSRPIASVETIDWAAVSDTATILFVRVHFAEGEPDTYQIPLLLSNSGSEVQGAVLHDAVEDEDFRQALLSIIEHEVVLQVGGDGRITGRHSALFSTMRGNQFFPSRVSSAEQSNTNILFGDTMILKLFRRLQPGENPDVEIGRFLTDVAHFPHIPRFLGEITLSRAGAEPTSCAMLQELVVNEGDGWQWTLDALAKYYEAATPDATPYLEAAALLGRRTAEMHLALATETIDEAIYAEPMTAIAIAEEAQRIGKQIHRALDTLQRTLPSLSDDAAAGAVTILSRRAALLAKADATLSHPPSGKLIRIHGDYHLGQVLRAKDDFVLLDFEGEPARTLAERRRKQSPLKDVAGMLRSFSYAAWVGLERRTRDHAGGKALLTNWCNAVSTNFLAAYRTTLAVRPDLLPDEPLATSLLNSYLLEKASYELLYELNNRPDWVRIPLAGLLAISEPDASAPWRSVYWNRDSPLRQATNQTMQQPEIYAILTPIFRDMFDNETLVLTPELTAASVPEWDSFNHINLIVAVEARLKIKFQTAELESMNTVGRMVDLIEKKLTAQGR